MKTFPWVPCALPYSLVQRSGEWRTRTPPSILPANFDRRTRQGEWDKAHMAAGHSIEGLIKWVRRDEWRDKFEDAFERHIGAACRGAGIDLDELAEIIGDHGVSNLWGCAFEDFVSSGPDEA